MIIPQTSFRIGQKVRIKPPGDYGPLWRADWQEPFMNRPILTIIGISLTRNLKLNFHLSEDWPKDGGFDDISEDDIEAVDG